MAALRLNTATTAQPITMRTRICSLSLARPQPQPPPTAAAAARRQRPPPHRVVAAAASPSRFADAARRPSFPAVLVLALASVVASSLSPSRTTTTTTTATTSDDEAAAELVVRELLERPQEVEARLLRESGRGGASISPAYIDAVVDAATHARDDISKERQ